MSSSPRVHWGWFTLCGRTVCLQTNGSARGGRCIRGLYFLSRVTGWTLNWSWYPRRLCFCWLLRPLPWTIIIFARWRVVWKANQPVSALASCLNMSVAVRSACFCFSEDWGDFGLAGSRLAGGAALLFYDINRNWEPSSPALRKDVFLQANSSSKWSKTQRFCSHPHVTWVSSNCKVYPSNMVKFTCMLTQGGNKHVVFGRVGKHAKCTHNCLMLRTDAIKQKSVFSAIKLDIY